MDLFPHLPGEARIWSYMASRDLSESEQRALIDGLGPFLSDWTSHQRVVTGESAILENRFLLLAATLADGDLSGCGIDKSVHAIEQIADALGFSWMDGLQVAFRDGGGIQSVSRSEFRGLVRAGAVSADTRVFDLSPSTLGELRAVGFERSASASWHARVFRFSVAEQP